MPPGVTVMANGSLHQTDRAIESLGQGADILAMERGALANPDLPAYLQAGRELRDFDSAILGPIADIKPQELAL